MVTESIQCNDAPTEGWQYTDPVLFTPYEDYISEDESSPDTTTIVHAGDSVDGGLADLALESIRSELNIKTNSITQVIAYFYGKSSGTNYPEASFYNGSSWTSEYDISWGASGAWGWGSHTFSGLTLSATASLRVRLRADCPKLGSNTLSCMYLKVTFTYRWAKVNSLGAGSIGKINGVAYAHCSKPLGV